MDRRGRTDGRQFDSLAVAAVAAVIEPYEIGITRTTNETTNPA